MGSLSGTTANLQHEPHLTLPSNVLGHELPGLPERRIRPQTAPLRLTSTKPHGVPNAKTSMGPT